MYPKYSSIRNLYQLFRSDYEEWINNGKDNSKSNWVLDNFEYIQNDENKDKIYSEGIIFQDWLDYFKYFCKNISKRCLIINGLYQIVYVYDEEFYSVPYKCFIGPKNLHCAIFVELFYDVWPGAIEYNNTTEYHPNTNALLTTHGLHLLLKDENWEIIDIPEELNLEVLGTLSLKELLGSYDKIISSFRVFYKDEQRMFEKCELLTPSWIDILGENPNLDLDSHFDVETELRNK